MAKDSAIWKALGDPTRRGLLDQLAAGPRTTGDLAAAFPDLSRFAIMKHLTILEAANLITWRKEGRERWNSLNAVPLRQLYDRWVSRLEHGHAGRLTALSRLAEDHARSTTMSTEIRTFDITQEIQINAPAESVWTILTTRPGEWWLEPYRLYDNHDTMTLDLTPGGLLMEETSEGEIGVWGHITKIRPGEMVELSGSCGMDFAVYSTFTFTVAPTGVGSTVTLRHIAMGPMGEGQGPGYSQGWNEMLGNLKKLAES